MNYKVRRILAGTMAAALLWASPGVGVYQALAQVVPVTIQTPVGGAMGVVGAGVGQVGAVQTQGPSIDLGDSAMSLRPGLVPIGTVPNAPNISGPLSLPHSVIVPADRTGQALTVPQAAVQEGIGSPSVTRNLSSSRRIRQPQGVRGLAPAAVRRSGAAASPALPKSKDGTGVGGISESLHAVRGQPNKLGSRFIALAKAFGIRRDAAGLMPGGSGIGGLAGRSVSPSVGRAVYAHDGGKTVRPQLRPSVGRRSAVSEGDGELKPPAKLTLQSSGRKDLKVVISESPVRAAVEGGKTAALGAGYDALASPPALDAQAPAETGKRSPWLGVGTVAMMFIGSLVVAQVGVEALGAAMPTLVQKTFGDFTVVAQLAIFSSIASVVGRQLGPLAAKRFGLKATYLGATAARLVSISVLAGLLATGSMTLPLMMFFYTINGFLSGISLTAMESIPPALVGQNPSRLERFWTLEQTILEIIGITGPIVTGAVVASWGFLPALVAFPVTMGVSLAIVLLTVRIPKRYERMRRQAITKDSHGFFAKIVYGAKLVWNNRALRYSFIAYAVYLMLNPFLYAMIGPAYGLRLIGPENAELATAVIGWLTGLYSFGGLLGGFLMMGAQKRVTARKQRMREEWERAHGPISDEDWAAKITPWESEVLRKSMLRWMILGTLGLAAFATMIFPLPSLGALVSLPAWLGWLGNLTLPALALIPFGVAQVVSVLKLRSFFQSRVPDANDMPDAMGFFGSMSLAVSTTGLLALKYLFKAFAGFTPFYYIAAAMIPLALLYLFLRHRIAASTLPAGSVAPPVEPAG